MSRQPHGYAGRILTVDLSSRTSGELSTQDYATGFVGGRGIAARLYWDRVPATAGALDPDNALVFATGPLAGIPSIGGSRWVAWLKRLRGSYVSSDVTRRIAERFWGSEMVADFSTHEGRAMAAKMIQNREHARDCLVLCSFLWPVLDIANSDDHAGDPSLESLFLSAVTGQETSEYELYRIGERVFNLQRAILVREGCRGKDEDQLPEIWYTRPLKGDPTSPECLVPGKNGEALSRKGAVVDRAEFGRTKDEYYRLRGWDPVTGLQSRARMEELDLIGIADGLLQKRLARD